MHHSANFIHLNRIQYKTQQNKQNKIIVIVVSYNMRCGPVRAHHIPHKVKTPTHDSIRELVTWQCKEHGVKS